MDFATLKAFTPSELEDAADGYRAISTMAERSKDRLDKQITIGLRDRLSGKAMEAALREIKALSENFHYTQTECGLAATALNAAAADFHAAKRKLDAVLADAAASNCTVNPDGSVSYPAGGKEVDGKTPEGSSVTSEGSLTDPTAQAIRDSSIRWNPNPNYGKALDFAERIGDAVKEATDADIKWAPKIRALTADDDLKVSYADWADARSDMDGVAKAADRYLDGIKEPPKEGTPAENAKWWKSLSDEERAGLVAMRPASIGALDGLPAEVRDEANRTVLAETRGKYEMALNAIPPEPSKGAWVDKRTQSGGVNPEWTEWYQKYGKEEHRLDTALNGMRTIEKRFDSTGTERLPEAYLLGFSAEGNGRAILANGNPDTADHTAVYVPGTTAHLGNIEGEANKGINLWRDADEEAGGQKVSTITWLGYDAPQDLVGDSPFRHYADDGAPAFNGFLDGLDASRTAESEGHRTVVAHSYGSTLVGSAARQGDLNADDVVFVGSPGVQVGSAAEMDVPKGHVWNQEADGDPVPDIGRWGHGGSQWHVGGGTAIAPSDELFGANQMTTDTTGHSDYWTPGTDSLEHQALVIVGKYGEVGLED